MGKYVFNGWEAIRIVEGAGGDIDFVLAVITGKRDWGAARSTEAACAAT